MVVLTLVGLDVLRSHVKRWSEASETWLDGKPPIRRTGPAENRHHAACPNQRGNVLMAARETEGLARMEQIKYVVLETSGGISIIPR